MCINGDIISVPKKNSDLRQKIRTNCRKCHICHNQRAMSWAHRCYSHYLQNPSGCYFVTLTLSDENMSDAPDKKEIARFHKSLRKKYERQGKQCEIKYFVVSEYGYSTERLHYHGIYFGLPYDQSVPYIQISNELAAVWGNGIAYVKPFDLSKVIYCLKYLHKDKELGNIMVNSKKLGHISDEMIKYINTSENFENFKVKLGNRTISMPRYYRKKYLHDDNKEKFSEYFAQKEELDRKKFVFAKKLYNFEQAQKRFEQLI